MSDLYGYEEDMIRAMEECDLCGNVAEEWLERCDYCGLWYCERCCSDLEECCCADCAEKR